MLYCGGGRASAKKDNNESKRDSTAQTNIKIKKQEERQGKDMSDDIDGKGRGKQWDTKAEEKACYGRSHQMALLHIVLKVIFLGR